jgi:hypothetical protein
MRVSRFSAAIYSRDVNRSYVAAIYVQLVAEARA